MGQITKRKYLQSLVDRKQPVVLTIYGSRHRTCVPVRVIGNVLNYKTKHSISEFNFEMAKINSVSLVSIHKVEEVGGTV